MIPTLLVTVCLACLVAILYARAKRRRKPILPPPDPATERPSFKHQ